MWDDYPPLYKFCMQAKKTLSKTEPLYQYSGKNTLKIQEHQLRVEK